MRWWRPLALAASVGLALACPVDGTDFQPGEGLDTGAIQTGVEDASDKPITWGDAAFPSTDADAQMIAPSSCAGGCPVGMECDLATSQCMKISECGDGGTGTSCLSEGVQCGSFRFLDRCTGERRDVSCGDCPSGSDCVSGRCICRPEANEVLCGNAHAVCGTVVAADRCGATRQVACGACSFGQVCAPGGAECRNLSKCGAAGACADPGLRCRPDGWCVECLGSGDCAAGKVCDPASNLCLDCLQDFDCADGAKPRCVAGAGTCVQCLSGADCPGGSCDVAARTCRAPAPANDGCAGAERVQVGGAGVAGDTTDATEDAAGTCGTTGPDVAYAFTVPQTGWYTVTVTPRARADAGAAFLPTVHVRSQCKVADTELGCLQAAAAGEPVALEVRLPAGEAVAWVGGATVGQFTFTVATSVEPHPTPAWDVCAGALPLLFSGTPAEQVRSVSLNGASTRAANDDFASGCSYSDGPDVVFKVSIPTGAPRKLAAQVTRLASTPAYQPTVYVRGTCADPAADLACSFSATGGTVRAVAGSLPAGDYFVVVDGASRSAGDFDLEVTLDKTAEPMADGCTGLVVTPPGPGGSVSFSSDTSFATNGGEGSCGGSGPDAVYHLTLAAPTALTAKVASRDGSALQPVVYVRRGDCTGAAAGSEVACDAATARDEREAVVTFGGQAAGDYYLWVDGFGLTRGAYTLTISGP